MATSVSLTYALPKGAACRGSGRTSGGPEPPPDCRGQTRDRAGSLTVVLALPLRASEAAMTVRPTLRHILLFAALSGLWLAPAPSAQEPAATPGGTRALTPEAIQMIVAGAHPDVPAILE